MTSRFGTSATPRALVSLSSFFSRSGDNTMIVRIVSRGAFALAAAAAPLQAQDPAPPSSISSAQIPVRELGPVEAKSTHTFNSVTSIRALPDGGLFVNDNQRRQLVRLDGTLQQVTILADTAGAPLPYGQRNAGLLSFLGDSTIVVDPATLALVVLNAQGKVVRVMAPPRINDINQLAMLNLGSNAFDPMGRIVYRGNPGGGGGGFGPGFNTGGGGGGFGGGGGGGRGQGGGQPGQPAGAQALQQQQRAAQARNNPLNQPDSVPVVRADFERRAADTIAWVKVPRTEMTMSTAEDGTTRTIAHINPLPQGDDWALMSDGTVAVVRVLDYHIDYYAPDGTRTASPKLPFDWKRITDEDKSKLVDSLRVAAKAATDRALAQANQGGGGGRFRMAFEPVAAERLPDYVPPIRPGTTLADHDGNVWLLPMTSNIAAQIAQQMSGGGGMPGMGGGPGGFPGGGRGGFGGPPGGGGGGNAAGGGRQNRAAGDTAGARRTQGDSAGARRAPGDSAGGRGAGAGPARPAAPFQLVYDVVNRTGELVERVKLPQNRTIVGFGPGGVVYLGFRQGNAMTIEKARRVSAR
jgi:hypothetical protein